MRPPNSRCRASSGVVDSPDSLLTRRSLALRRRKRHPAHRLDLTRHGTLRVRLPSGAVLSPARSRATRTTLSGRSRPGSRYKNRAPTPVFDERAVQTEQAITAASLTTTLSLADMIDSSAICCSCGGALVFRPVEARRCAVSDPRDTCTVATSQGLPGLRASGPCSVRELSYRPICSVAPGQPGVRHGGGRGRPHSAACQPSQRRPGIQ